MNFKAKGKAQRYLMSCCERTEERFEDTPFLDGSGGEVSKNLYLVPPTRNLWLEAGLLHNFLLYGVEVWLHDNIPQGAILSGGSQGPMGPVQL